MKKMTLAVLSGLLYLSANAQELETDTAEIESIDEVLISAQRLGEKRINSSRQIEVISSRQMELAQQPTMGEVLGQTGQVFVQKSQLGGGSPVIRGFEASRNLLVIDGVRMNNATYRAGHLQDIITVDAFMLDRAEIYFGSGSTLYGSDALGGVVYMKTKQARFTDKFTFTPSALVRYASAGNNLTGNIGWNMGSKNVAWLFNYTYNKFGDLTMGRGKNYSGIDTFGLRKFYAVRENGADVIKTNPDPYIQKNSGYDQSDISTKVSVNHGKLISTVNFQASLNNGMPRYDRLTQTRNGLLRFGEWSYTPQNRFFASYTATYTPSDKASHRLILSHQHTEVGRATRQLDSVELLTQLDKVNVYAVNYDFQFQLSDKLKFISGAEWVYNKVNSDAFLDSVNNGKRRPSGESRYADSFANTNAVSIFTNLVYEIKPNDFSVNAGIRVSNYAASAAFTQNNFWKLNYSEAQVRNTAPVFNLGAVKKVFKGLFATVNLSTGFRNPNIDDLTKLFESAPGLKYIVPNSDLLPEQTRTLDLGIRYAIKDVINIEAGVYRTDISNLLIDMPSTLNGQDSVNYKGQLTPVYQMKNAASGFVRGAYVGGKVKIMDHLYSDFYYATTYGRYKANENATEQPLDHIAPDHGRLGLRYAKSNLQIEAFMLFNGWKLAKDYSPSGEDNANFAPQGRTPAWETYNIRAAYALNKHFNFTLAVENILDLNYRVFASGISAPGRNIVASVRVNL